MSFNKEEISDMLLLSSNPRRQIDSAEGRAYIKKFKDKNLILLACLITGLNINDYFSKEEVIGLRRTNHQNYENFFDKKTRSFVPDYAFFDKLIEQRKRPLMLKEAGNLMYGDVGFGNPVYKLNEQLVRIINRSFYKHILGKNTKISRQRVKELFN